MGYYMGDYYAGSRGDPGIGSFFGSIASGLASFIPGVGGIVSKGISAITNRGASNVAGKVAATGGAIVKAGKGVIMKHPVLSAAGAAGAIGATGVVAGRLSRGAGAMTVGGRIRRHRRMNVCNPRALRKAIRRTHGFAKLAMRTIHLVHPKKKVRFGGFRKKKAHK